MKTALEFFNDADPPLNDGRVRLSRPQVVKMLQEYSDQQARDRHRKAVQYWHSEVGKASSIELPEGDRAMSKLVRATVKIAAGIETTKE